MFLFLGGYLTIKYSDIQFPKQSFILHEIYVHFIKLSSPGHVNFFIDCPDHIKNLVDMSSRKISDRILDENSNNLAPVTNHITNVLYFVVLFVIKQIVTHF